MFFNVDGTLIFILYCAAFNGVGLPHYLQDARAQVSLSTNFDLEPSFCTPPPKEMITNPNPSAGNIHLKLTEVNRKCHIENIEVSSPNKTLNNVVVEAPKVDLGPNSRLDFMEVPENDEQSGISITTKCVHVCQVISLDFE